ncbi:mandelate racemase [Aquabacter cavernae]|uniref:mandelate racemase n=1 Tax=Aquabacter cavernae TaxID=2496029 RepID=UPI000F8E1B91
MPDSPLLKVETFRTQERTVDLRLPFRFGVATVTRATQITLTVRIALKDGRSGEGHAAESLLPKWFDKKLTLSDADNMNQLRTSLAIALKLYLEAGFDTAFGQSAHLYREQQARCAAQGLNPLVASYGPALVDRAVIDALGRILGLSFAQMIRANLPGLYVGDLTPDLAGFDLPGFLAGLSTAPSIAVRHTVGLVDALDDADVSERRNDGLPETLEDVVRAYGGRYYKLKVGGDVEADLDRLSRIAAVLDAGAGDYLTTLDGNEQYETVDGITELWRRMGEAPALRRLVASVLLIEQPIKRAVALERSVAPLGQEKPLIIDESDGDIGAFPKAIALGYRGVSSKNCKGFYKSILNTAHAARLNGEQGSGRYFLSAEDLSTWPGLCTQQDLALVSLLGLTHVERNGHHYIDGMTFAPEAEQAAFLAAHGDLYHRAAGHPARLRISRGDLAIASLDCPGFGCAIAPGRLD